MWNMRITIYGTGDKSHYLNHILTDYADVSVVCYVERTKMKTKMTSKVKSY